jgi:hypothetical protein
MFRAGLYARVSTNDQQTIPLQLRALREYVTRRGWTIVLQVKEVGSGAAQRQLREKLLEAARRREIDVVLVWRLDRWGRSVADLLANSRNWSISVWASFSLTEALDLTTPAGRAMAGLLAVFADSNARFCASGFAPAWRTPGRTARNWVVPSPLDSMPNRYGSCIAPASLSPKSLTACRLAVPRFDGFWDDPISRRNI